MNQKELLDQSNDQLCELKFKLLRENLTLSLKAHSDEVTKTHRFKQIRRTIARILTIQTARSRSEP